MANPLIQGASGIEGAKLTYASVNENERNIYSFTANESVSWSISGGEKSFFSIDKDSGQLSFKESPDFESFFAGNQTILKFETNFEAIQSNIKNVFYVELYDKDSADYQTTNITANNFLKYVNDASYARTFIHRLVKDFIIQSGSFIQPTQASNQQNPNPTFIQSKGTIKNEPGNSNLMGTIAMAKVAGDPDSATSGWFINLADNFNLDSQNGGFSAFGHVLGNGIRNPLLVNTADIYQVNYPDIGLNLDELPLFGVNNNVVEVNNYFAFNSITSIGERPSDISNTYNVIVTAEDIDGNKSNQYVIVDINDIKGETLTGDSFSNTLKGGLGNDIFEGGTGNDNIDGGTDFDRAIYSGNFSDYEFAIANKIVTIKDNRLTLNDGTDTLSNIERLTFADKNAVITSKGVMSINSLGFQSEKIYSGNSDMYVFYDLGNDKYGVQTSTGIDELTGYSNLKFNDKNLNLFSDIKETFDQLTGMNDATGQMFRLYNAAFARFPDADGLRYWINNFSSGIDDSRAVSSSFLVSDEFKTRYGENISNEVYVKNLYLNVLDRELDQPGYDYWVGNLNNGIEERHEVLLGFAESAENKGLFSEMTRIF